MGNARSDRELAGAVVELGDERAFRVLYKRHTPLMYRFVLRLMGGNATDAEDVLQEAWLRAARALPQFRWESALSSWLSGIALNCVREWARKRGRSLSEVSADWDLPAVEREPGKAIDLERALALLPDGFRTVLVLHDVEGFTHEEIGERLGISDGTSKSQLSRARRAMRRLLGTGLEAETV
jgi:RNA polymerase sigma-70 factor, ECF subfamily